MKGKVFLFQWDKSGALRRAQDLYAIGWYVEIECEDGARGGKKVLAQPPDAVVLDLARKPAHSRETAQALRGFKAGRYVPIIFVDGSKDDIQKAKTKIPNAVFVKSEQLPVVLNEVHGQFTGKSVIERQARAS
ncbi:MAG: hypothetical protein K1Y36_28715 [Blastocatellia bacterium]|nr:hypothetical protein [Blastocatellia bacterium]